MDTPRLFDSLPKVFLATEDLPSGATEDMSSVTTEDMSSVATEGIGYRD